MSTTADERRHKPGEWGFKTCGPNEAMVVSGCFHSRPQMVPGGRVFVWPWIQRIDRISLNTMTLKIESPRIYTKLGVPVTVIGVAQVKIQGSEREMLSRACEQFLGKTEDEICDIAKETLEGHQRAILGSMTVEGIYRDRKTFSSEVFKIASDDLATMGISVVSYTLKDIKDDEGYLKSLGLARTSQVKRDARIGEAAARKDAGIKEALAQRDSTKARTLNDIDIAKAQMHYELQTTIYQQEIQTKKAEAEMAHELQSVKTRQAIKFENMEVENVKMKKQIEVQDLEITLKDRRLDATVRKPAEAQSYCLQRLAEAEKAQQLKEASSEADATRLKGEALAHVHQLKAKAEADAMLQKANAMKEFGEAAKLQLLLEAMPRVAAEITNPLSNCKKVTMVSGPNGPIGVARLTSEVLEVMQNLPSAVHQLSGINLREKILCE